MINIKPRLYPTLVAALLVRISWVNIYCLPTNLRHFLTPIPLLSERHISPAPLSKSTYQWTRLKRSFEFLLFTQMCFDISLDHAFVRRGSCFTSCFSKTKTRWHDWSQSFSHFLHVLLSLINLVTEALGEFLLLGRWLNTFTACGHTGLCRKKGLFC